MRERNPQAMNCVEFLLEMEAQTHIVNNKGALPPLPKEWAKLVSGKSIILYCLSKNTVQDLIQGNGEGLKYRFTFIRKSFGHTRRYLLWWYDDGLLRQACEQIRDVKPDLLEAYEDLVRDFKEVSFSDGDGVFIYDGSADLERAVRWADAYYGDDTICMQLCMSLGKVIIKQDFTRQAHFECTMRFEEWLDEVAGNRQRKKMPQAWSDKIAGRKVVLRWMEGADLLACGAVILDRLEDTLRQFIDKPGMAFWWICDRDIRDLVSLMSENAEEHFFEILDTIKKSDNCIYDYSGDLDRAVLHADVLYGSSLPLINNFKARGKEKLLQHLSAVPDWISRMGMAPITVCDNRAYFIARGINLLMYVDLVTKKVEVAEIIDEQNLQEDLQFSYIFHCSNKLIMVPFFNTVGFTEYDLSTGNLENIDFPVPNESKISFFNAVKYEEKIYFLSYGYPALVIYDINEGKYRYSFEVYATWKNDLYTDDGCYPAFCLSDAVGWAGRLYIVTPFSNKIISLDPVTLEFEYVPVGRDDYGYQRIFHDGNSFWLVQNSATKNLVHWNYDTGQTTEVSYPDDCDMSRVKNGYCGFSGIVQQDRKMYFFPDMANEVLVLDLDTREIKAVDWLTDLLKGVTFDFKWFDFAVTYGDYIYASLSSNKCLYKIDTKTQSYEEYRIAMPLDTILQRGMSDLLEDVAKGAVGSSGHRIYETIVQ